MQAYPVPSVSKSVKGLALIPPRILPAAAAVVTVSMRPGEGAAHSDRSSGPTYLGFGQRRGPAAFDPRGL